MNKHNRKQAEWLWQELQNLTERAEAREMHSLLIVWSYLRFSSSLNFARAPNTGAAMSVALETLSAALEEARESSDTNSQGHSQFELNDEVPPGVRLH